MRDGPGQSVTSAPAVEHYPQRWDEDLERRPG